MKEKGGQPLLTLTPRSDEGPSRVVVAPHASVGGTIIWRTIARYVVALTRRVRKTIRMILAAEPDDLLSYTPKRDKIVEGVLLLLERAGDLEVVFTTQSMAATMFLADKGHLDAYGRPVFFDNYVATAAGPAGLAAMEMFDPAFDWVAFGPDTTPWTVETAREGRRLRGTRPPNLRRLSQSDVEALGSALSIVTALDVDQLQLFTHRQAAYAAALLEGEGSRLDPRLVPDQRDDELIDDLVYASRHAFVAPRRS